MIYPCRIEQPTVRPPVRALSCSDIPSLMMSHDVVATLYSRFALEKQIQKYDSKYTEVPSSVNSSTSWLARPCGSCMQGTCSVLPLHHWRVRKEGCCHHALRPTPAATGEDAVERGSRALVVAEPDLRHDARDVHLGVLGADRRGHSAHALGQPLNSPGLRAASTRWAEAELCPDLIKS
jgi:hypothetical protein